ncbi:transposase [Pseudonocardia bannensis]
MSDAVRLGPADDATAVTAHQLRAVVARLIAAGPWRGGGPDVLIVMDAGGEVTRLAFVLADPPGELLARIRSDRVLRLPEPPRLPGVTGRPPKHGPEFALDRPATWPEPAHTTTTDTTRSGIATAASWARLHPRLTHRGCWAGHDGDLPIIEGTLIRLQVEHLPGDRDPEPGWAVVLDHRRRPRRHRPLLAVLPAPLRSRAHLPAAQADPGLDRSEDPHPAGGRPLELARDRRAHPTPPRPTVGREPSPALGGPTHRAG